MVGRKNKVLVTKRSLRNADSALGKRPKRVVQAKVMEETVGMSRQEEQALNKALYASLQENRKSKSMPCLLPTNGGDASPAESENTLSTKSSRKNVDKIHSKRGMKKRLSLPDGARSRKLGLSHRRSLRTGKVSPQRLKTSNSTGNLKLKRSRSTHSAPSSRNTTPAFSSRLSIDESSQDSVRSSTSSANGSKKKIHAQRKFAQGCSLPGTPTSTPVKQSVQLTKKLSSRMPKTEDFLTFLCLRGTSHLPPHLEFFNYCKEEQALHESRLATQESSSRPNSANNGKGKRKREGTPDSSSTSSGANEEVAETASAVVGGAKTSTMVSSSKLGGATTATTAGSSISTSARRSAARASAGTPETARGIVSLRQGLQRKVAVSPSSSRSSRSSSPCFPVTSAFYSPRGHVPSTTFSPRGQACHAPLLTSSTAAGSTSTKLTPLDNPAAGPHRQYYYHSTLPSSSSHMPTNPRFNHRPKFYFTPEKSPSPLSPAKASGVRPGEFTPPRVYQSYYPPYYHGTVRNFSPLVCSPSTNRWSDASQQNISGSSTSFTYPRSPSSGSSKLKDARKGVKTVSCTISNQHKTFTAARKFTQKIK